MGWNKVAALESYDEQLADVVVAARVLRTEYLQTAGKHLKDCAYAPLSWKEEEEKVLGG
jgi:hypothetical protein